MALGVWLVGKAFSECSLRSRSFASFALPDNVQKLSVHSSVRSGDPCTINIEKAKCSCVCLSVFTPSKGQDFVQVVVQEWPKNSVLTLSPSDRSVSL